MYTQVHYFKCLPLMVELMAYENGEIPDAK
jgi:hypothetical protein